MKCKFTVSRLSPTDNRQQRRVKVSAQTGFTKSDGVGLHSRSTSTTAPPHPALLWLTYTHPLFTFTHTHKHQQMQMAIIRVEIWISNERKYKSNFLITYFVSLLKHSCAPNRKKQLWKTNTRLDCQYKVTGLLSSKTWVGAFGLLVHHLCWGAQATDQK